MMDVPIRLIKGFLSPEETISIIKHIDGLEVSHPDGFRYDLRDPMVFMEFGKDFERPEGVSEIDMQRHSLRKLHGLDTLDLLPRDALVYHFNRVIARIRNDFNELRDLYVNEFRIAKYHPGVTVTLHSDDDEGFSSHLKYSAVLYLNTMHRGGGKISFVDHGYSHLPEDGDLLIFPSLEGGYHEVTEILETRYSIAVWLTDQPELALY
jgi:hypothetical protein